jgi:uncharacterized protein YecE (DUF72 family)
MGGVWIGTSGWHYASWWGPFFPKGIRKKDALRYYASQLPATELNAPFYRTPSEEAVKGWFAQTPDDFVFAWKASKFMTHWKRLSEKSDNSIVLLDSRVKLLRHKAGPILFQLPPHFEADHERLATFLKMVPRRWRCAFEFRHRSWYDEATFTLLSKRKVALCISDHHDAPAPWVATAPHVYLRPHGPGGRYRGSYDDKTLRDWARRIRAWQREGRDVFCFFDNDQKSAAPKDARRLIALITRT